MRFVVRQPIFDHREQVAGYFLEIEKPSEGLPDPADEVATVTVALERIPQHSWAMVDCGARVLSSAAVRQLPVERVVLALPDEGHESAEMLNSARALHRAGYKFAIAHFQPNDGWEPYFALVDWVALSGNDAMCMLRQSMAAGQARHARLIARNLPTRTARAEAQKCGFRYFEGAFYLTSEQQLARELPASKIAALRLLAELQQPILNYVVLENLIKAEPSFYYRLMRYLNSAAFYGLQQVKTIRHALSLLGDQELRRWLALMATVSASQGVPSETVICAMLRARLCEVLFREAPDLGFMTGLFSLMPLVVNMQLQVLLTVVHLPTAVEQALWGDPGSLRMLLDLAVAFERAQWNVVRDLAYALHLTEEQVDAARGEASAWTNKILSTQVTEPRSMSASLV